MYFLNSWGNGTHRQQCHNVQSTPLHTQSEEEIAEDGVTAVRTRVEKRLHVMESLVT